MAFFEFRHYKVRPGTRDRWVQLMDERLIPFQRSFGIDVVGAFVDAGDPDRYIWLGRFESEAEHAAQYDAAYTSETWTNEFKPSVEEMMVREEFRSIRLDPTPGSGIR